MDGTKLEMLLDYIEICAGVRLIVCDEANGAISLDWPNVVSKKPVGMHFYKEDIDAMENDESGFVMKTYLEGLLIKRHTLTGRIPLKENFTKEELEKVSGIKCSSL